jgi:cytochrome P450
VITLTTYEEARDAFRRRELRQALYEEGAHLMDGVIVNLHGSDHIARRRLENRLFRRDTFAWYERERIPQIVTEVLRDPIAEGRGELVSLARRTMMALSIDVAGVDTAGTDEQFERLYDLMNRLARASTVAHAVGDKQAIVDDGDQALAAFDAEFFQPAKRRRSEMIEQVQRGELGEDRLPRDVLTTLLLNEDQLHLPGATVLREVAYFPWVGSHSTSAQLVHAMHHIFTWLDDHPADRHALEHDDALRQRFVHESMRLHPASPVALRIATHDITLKSGREIAEGETVEIDLERANRDPAVFGDDAEAFMPSRTIAGGASPWGLSFGHGTHACLGQELAAGLEPDDGLEHHLLGSVVLLAGSMLRAGARLDPTHGAVLDARTTRQMWGTYPVLFDPLAQIQ